MSDDIAAYERERKRRTRLRNHLRADAPVALRPGWAVAPSRTAHQLIDGRAKCGTRWVEDGAPPPAPVYECRVCRRVDGEDWSEFG